MQLCLAAAVAQSRQLLLEPFRATQGAQVHLEPAILHNPVDTGPNDKWPQLNSSSLRPAKLVRLRHSLLTGGHASLGMTSVLSNSSSTPSQAVGIPGGLLSLEGFFASQKYPGLPPNKSSFPPARLVRL